MLFVLLFEEKKDFIVSKEKYFFCLILTDWVWTSLYYKSILLFNKSIFF
jgi:hypothetical protein